MVATLFLMGYFELLQVQKNCESTSRDEKKKPLKKTTRFVIFLFVTYLLISLLLIYSICTRGYYNWQRFFSQVMEKVFFTIMKVQLFLILAMVDLKITLHS